MGRLIDADKIIFREIDEIGGEYEPYLGCSKSQINSLPTVEAIPKADYEQRLKADMVAMLTDIRLEIEEKFNDRPFSYNHHQRTEFYRDIDEVIQQKINSLEEA